MPDYGYIAARYGLPNSAPIEAGQVVDGYELLAPLPRSRPTPLNGRTAGDAHAEARRLAADVTSSIESKDWRKDKVHRCTCKRAPALVIEAIAPNARRWALVVRGNEIPPAFRGPAAREAEPLAWPLHCEPNGAPHVDFVICPRCRATYCVALTPTAAHLIPTRPRYGSRVVE